MGAGLSVVYERGVKDKKKQVEVGQRVVRCCERPEPV